MKKILGVVIIIAMIFSQAISAMAIEIPNSVNAFQGTIVDDYGNVITSIVTETMNENIVEVYCNGSIDHRVVTNKATGEAILEKMNEGIIISTNTCDLNSYVEPVMPTLKVEEFGPVIEPLVELIPATDFSIEKLYPTDYVYNGSILYGETDTSAYELSEAYRYEGHMLQFSAGTAVGIVLSVLLAYYGGAITVKTLGELGIPAVAGTLIDSFMQEVCFTKYRVVTKASFASVLTVYAGKTYDKVLVTAGAGGNDHYSTGYYGYDIVDNWASTCCNYGAAAFSEKYITQHNPNLSLPITSIP